MEMFGVSHRIAVEDPDAPNHVYPGSCRLMGVFCSSVGLTGLPVDPTPPIPPDAAPVVASVTPDQGPDGTDVVIAGTSFGVQGPNSRVSVGTEDATVTAWSDTEITATVAQGGNLPDIPSPVIVHTDDGKTSQVSPAPGFTFTAVARAATERKDAKSAKKKGKGRRNVVDATSLPEVEETTMPTFPSGAGVMLRDGTGKILVGPFELEAGRLYTLPMNCPNGLEVVPSGIFDITLLLMPPL